MSQLSADVKHTILLEYAAHEASRSFSALARRHGVKGGGRTVQRWHSRWNRTPDSLKHAPVPGRPRILTRAETSRHVRAPILAANRAHRAVSYTQLLPDVRRKTRKSIALRTLQQIGQEQLGIKSQHTSKRTAQEGESTHTCGGARVLLLLVY
jgi:transposase